jgi:hypothetical protein
MTQAKHSHSVSDRIARFLHDVADGRANSLTVSYHLADLVLSELAREGYRFACDQLDAIEDPIFRDRVKAVIVGAAVGGLAGATLGGRIAGPSGALVGGVAGALVGGTVVLLVAVVPLPGGKVRFVVAR